MKISVKHKVSVSQSVPAPIVLALPVREAKGISRDVAASVIETARAQCLCTSTEDLLSSISLKRAPGGVGGEGDPMSRIGWAKGNFFHNINLY
jgi:hypothetical protein